ncbi:uncharacterized protein DUF3842 [Garciella nitratireducens]|nr:uncharacterized protein DUF3842 [Garciella nitratireducens]
MNLLFCLENIVRLVVFFMKIAIIDGQGGGIGKRLIEKIRKATPDSLEIIALGTNSIATFGMMKAGASKGATGENSIVVQANKVDVIMGPIAILIANSIMGEITPKIAYAIGNSEALKILIPVNKCRTKIPGIQNKTMNQLLDDAIEELLIYYNTNNPEKN